MADAFGLVGIEDELSFSFATGGRARKTKVGIGQPILCFTVAVLLLFCTVGGAYCCIAARIDDARQERELRHVRMDDEAVVDDEIKVRPGYI